MVVETSRPIADVARDWESMRPVLGTGCGGTVRSTRMMSRRCSCPNGRGLRELERRNRELEMENAFLKKQPRTSHGSLGEREV